MSDHDSTTAEPSQDDQLEKHYVVGGVYTDFTHTQLAPNSIDYRIGPFLSIQTAEMAVTAKRIDHKNDTHAHFYIISDRPQVFWVIGGKYTDTSFSVLQDGEVEERLGPFHDYQEAVKVWRERAVRNVDDACTRYRLDKI